MRDPRIQPAPPAPPAAPRPRGRRGFTLVELLVVIAIAILLIGLLIVGLNRATKAAQNANTSALMLALRQGLVRFHEDLGYYPPVLGLDRALDPGPGIGASPEDIQNWFSDTSLAEYLIGYDRNTRDGYGSDDLGEVPYTGIRSPGGDGVWGAGAGGALDRRNPVITGKVYGPYLELDNERLLASTDGTVVDGKLQVAFPGEARYDPDGTKVIVDYWGNPIEYFRRPYPPGALGQAYRGGVDYNGDGRVDDADQPPTLADVIRLRPFANTFDAGAATDGLVADNRGDTTATFELKTAEFALFSPGADRTFDAWFRVDDDETNLDNIVETGP